MTPRVMLARFGAGLSGIALAVAAAVPAWAEPTPLDSDDPAVRAGTLAGRLLIPCCCFMVLICLVAVLVVLMRRRRDRRAQQQAAAQYHSPPQPPYPPQYPPYR
jgi:hypothetical protein